MNQFAENCKKEMLPAEEAGTYPFSICASAHVSAAARLVCPELMAVILRPW
jgi:hypothetical protein